MADSASYDPAQDLTAGANYIGALQQQGIAQQANARKTAAYNAWKAVYGPQAGDPAAALIMQEFGQRQETNPIAVQQAQAGLTSTQQQNAFAAQANPLKLTGLSQVNTGQAQEIAQKAQLFPGELAQQGATLASTKAEVGLKGAQASMFGAEAGKAGVETDVQRQALAFANGADVTGSLISTRNAAIKAGATDGGAAAIAGSLPTLIPAMTAAGIPLAQAQAIARQAATNPAVLDSLQSLSTTHYNNLAQAKGMPVLTPEALQQAAQNYKATGQPTVQGMGGAKVNAAVINAAAATPEGITNVPAAQQGFKSRQTYMGQLANTSPNAVGGKLASISAIAAHADLMEQFTNALHNGDLRAANAAQQAWKEQTGSPMPTNFDAQKQLLAGELTRYYTSRGSVEMQKGFESDMSKANSPAQLMGVLNTWRQDAGAQVQGYRQQAMAFNAGDEFDKHLTPAATALGTGGSAPAAPQAFQEGQTATGPNGQKAVYRNGAWRPAQ